MPLGNPRFYLLSRRPPFLAFYHNPMGNTSDTITLLIRYRAKQGTGGYGEDAVISTLVHFLNYIAQDAQGRASTSTPTGTGSLLRFVDIGAYVHVLSA